MACMAGWLLLPAGGRADNVNPLFAPRQAATRTLQVGTVFSQTGTLSPFDGVEAVNALSVNANVVLDSICSFARFILEDADGTEYLVAECSRQLNDTSVVCLENYGEETCLLNNVRPVRMRIAVRAATVTLQSIHLSAATGVSSASANLQSAAGMVSMRRQQVEQKAAAINSYNERNGLLWRAGVTEIAQRPYSERKQMMGISDDACNTGGFEYYKGGIFMMPETATSVLSSTPSIATTSLSPPPYVNEFDWRNRHGKNWITPAKKQEGYTCWAFGAISLVESYINLYYNRLLNYDLSEQEIVMFGDPVFWRNGQKGGHLYNALSYISKNGVVEESCLPFTFPDTTTSCLSPSERIKIEDFEKIEKPTGFSTYANLHFDVLKKIVIQAPTGIDFQWLGGGHSALLFGYKRILEGMPISMEPYGNVSPLTFYVEAGSPLIGQHAWLIKNSYGDDWGDNGCCYFVAEGGDGIKIYRCCVLQGRIDSMVYTDEDVNCSDEDGDGYYFWGVGEKPESCPSWVPDTPDGDDSDYSKGPMDEYGNCMEINPNNNDTIFITEDTVWQDFKYLYSHVLIRGNATLTVKDTVTFYKGCSITVENGGGLLVDGGKLNHIILKPQNGSSIIVKGNGHIALFEEQEWNVPLGTEIEINHGSVEF